MEPDCVVPEAPAGCECYTLRRVNPLLGVVAVVKTSGARALSLDGTSWQIQVLAHAPRGLWSGGGHEPGLRYFRFGSWSRAEGTTRVPLNPILDAGKMVEESGRLTDEVRRAESNLPFPVAGELEQWLLDRQGAPLALIATALPGSDLDTMDGGAWSAGGRGAPPFTSTALLSEGIAVRDASGRHGHCDALEQLIAEAAGPRPEFQWFRPEGADLQGLKHRAPSSFKGRRLPRQTFPPLGLRTRWAEPRARRLVDDYVSWLAPYLLALPGLSDDLRRGLEREAVRRALLVDAIWRLYPRVLDKDLLNRARIEATLRRASV